MMGLQAHECDSYLMACPLCCAQVTAFSRWEKVLPKLIQDPRYKALSSAKERRQIFDDFCRNVAEEQKASQARKVALR